MLKLKARGAFNASSVASALPARALSTPCFTIEPNHALKELEIPMISSSVKAHAKATRSGNSLRLEVRGTSNASFVASALPARASAVFVEHLPEIVPTVSLHSCKGIVIFWPDFDFFFTRL